MTSLSNMFDIVKAADLG